MTTIEKTELGAGSDILDSRKNANPDLNYVTNLDEISHLGNTGNSNYLGWFAPENTSTTQPQQQQPKQQQTPPAKNAPPTIKKPEKTANASTVLEEKNQSLKELVLSMQQDALPDPQKLLQIQKLLQEINLLRS
jgi:hypothetical protein